MKHRPAPEMQDPSASELRRSAAIRVGLSVLIAGAVTAIAIVALWGPLDVRTDVVGYSIHSNFNGYNYFNAYYLAVGFFPVASLLLFLGLTRLGPRIGLPVAASRGSLRPTGPPPPAQSALEGDPPLAAAPLARRRTVAVARVAFVGAVLGLETGIAIDAIWWGLALGLVIYVVLAALATVALDHWGPQDWSPEQQLAAVNSVGAPLCVAGLIAVSASTQVKILSDGSTKHYPWFPAWLGVPMAVALAGWVVIALRRASPASVAGVERRTLALVAAPVCLFVLLSSLAGDLSRIDTFDGGQSLVANRLVGDGWLPWRDIVVAHGLLLDVVNSAIGFTVLENSYWGNYSGNGLLTGPLYLVFTYFLLVYLVGRNWLFLLLSGLIMVGTVFAPTDFRFILWPLILLLLAADLDHPTPLRSAGLAFIAVVQTIVTPEAAPALLAVTVVVIGYELYNRRAGQSLAADFPRTIWFAGAGIVCAAAFAIYLASRGALDDLVYVTINLVRGHTIDGQLPPNQSGDSQFDVLAFAPPAALLISFAYAVTRLRSRRGFLTADWVMAAAAILLLFYYPKFLSRMDTGHAYQPFVVALPLLLYIVYRAVSAIEGVIRERWPANPGMRVTAHPVSLVLVVLVAIPAWGHLHSRVANAPASYRPAAAAPPQFARVGYTQAFDGAAYRDLKRVVDAYLNPDDRLYDFTDEGALFFYFMERDPSTRYFLAASVTDTAELQSDVIDRLERAPPKLIVFDNTGTTIVGLPNMDGVPTMVRDYKISQWILDHYRPLLSTHGQTIYARRDLPSPSSVGLKLSEKPATRGVAFLSQPCNWGKAPNFLSSAVLPPPDATSVPARATTPSRQLVTFYGWAGDPGAKAPAKEVIATSGGKIVGRTTPQIERPDLVDLPGFSRAGFNLSIPISRAQGGDALKIYAVAQDGAVSELQPGGGPADSKTAQLGPRTLRLDPNAVVGSIDTTRPPAELQITLPPGSRWDQFRWLELNPRKSGFGPGAVALYDRPRRPSGGREIGFQTLDDSPDRYIVPVGSCAQWHGYKSDRLFLDFYPPQPISAVRLIR